VRLKSKLTTADSDSTPALADHRSSRQRASNQAVPSPQKAAKLLLNYNIRRQPFDEFMNCLKSRQMHHFLA
jgi:hypothetical protein